MIKKKKMSTILYAFISKYQRYAYLMVEANKYKPNFTFVISKMAVIICIFSIYYTVKIGKNI